MDCPPMMRGNCYPTHLSARNVCYSPCVLCQGCQNFNTHSLVCSVCESRKPVDLICIHSTEQKSMMRALNTMFKKSMAHPDDRLEQLEVPSGNEELEQILENGTDPSGLGRLTPLGDLR